MDWGTRLNLCCPQEMTMIPFMLLNCSEQGAGYVIPPQSNISEPWPVDWWLYKERHLVECFFQKLKWFRRIATRYDKLDASFLAFVYLASIAILLI